MSYNRENIIWQSKDGTWNRAFYDFYDTKSWDDPSYDSEWDVDYTDDFNWVSTGHLTKEAAWRSWGGANPGGHSSLAYSRATAKECAALDEKVWRFRNPEAALKKDARERRAKIKKTITEQGLAAGSYVKVTYVDGGGAAAARAGWMTGWSVTETLKAEGDWLVIPTTKRVGHAVVNRSVKVYNTKTGRVHTSITGIAKHERQRGRGYGYGYGRRW